MAAVAVMEVLPVLGTVAGSLFGFLGVLVATRTKRQNRKDKMEQKAHAALWASMQTLWNRVDALGEIVDTQRSELSDCHAERAKLQGRVHLVEYQLQQMKGGR